MSGSGAGGGRGITWREQIASAWAVMAAAAAAPSASADRSIRLAVSCDAGQSGEQAAGFGERDRGCRPGRHLGQTGRHRGSRHAEFGVPGHDPVTALPAVVVGPAHIDGAKDGVDGLGAVGHELRLVPGPALHPGTPVANVGGQQVFQQPRAQPCHGGADRQLHRLQASAAGAQRPGGQPGEVVYLSGGLRRERRGELGAEPPFSAPGPAGGSSAGAVGGRASQIASFTSLT